MSKLTNLQEQELTELGILECETHIEYLERQLESTKAQRANLIIDLKKIKNRKDKCDLGIELEDERLNLGLSIKDLCLLASISEPAYRSLIRGKSNPRKKTLSRIKTVLSHFGSLRRYKK
jgi:hypothetical protein